MIFITRVIRIHATVLLLVATVQGGEVVSGMHAVYDATTGRASIREAGRPVLHYVYQTVPIPEGFFQGQAASHLAYARQYAVPRSNYIHPLFGPDGIPLTADWCEDHPHHRGIYWAWPEVQFNGEQGDLHALQRVWSRPTGALETRQGEAWAEVVADNRWMWEDRTPIVRETATIRAWSAGEQARHIDLTLHFEALEDGVTLARRGTRNYGGLNTRLAPVGNLAFHHHADPPQTAPRMAWQAATGTWEGAETPLSVTVFEGSGNPGYPGDFVKFPNLPWFQPTFPVAGTRYPLLKGQALVLNYRIWIRRGAPPDEKAFRAQWAAYQSTLKGKE